MVENNLGIKTYTLNIDEFQKLIHKKVYEYMKRNKEEPKYIKVPKWVYDILSRSDFGLEFRPVEIRPVNRGIFGQPETLFGYIVCPTVSIVSLDDIEVF